MTAAIASMSLHRKAFFVWLAFMMPFVAIASTVGPRFDPVDEAGGMERLIEAATAHAKALREDANVAEAERWDHLAAAAKAELAAR
jgi:hypothetical protein